jgi:hypothetical protein
MEAYVVDPKSLKEKVIAYYDQEAAAYSELYTKAALDTEFYPANAVRLDMIVDLVRARGAPTDRTPARGQRR